MSNTAPREGWSTADGWTVLWRTRNGWAVEHQDGYRNGYRVMFAGPGARKRAFEYLRLENVRGSFDLNNPAPGHVDPLQRAIVTPLY